jgi:hypothetical protein
MSSALQRAAALFLWPLVLAPAVAGFLYVRWFGVSVVFSDAWSMVRLFEGWHSGTLSLSELWAPHNEHRMLFPKGVELMLGLLTKYDNVDEMYLIEACFLTTLVVLFFAFAETVAVGTRLQRVSPWLLALFIPISLLVFSFRQYENMLFGFQINFAFTQTFGVLALFLLRLFARGRPGGGLRESSGDASEDTSAKFPFFILVGALACATVAAFSTVQGLLVWPAGLVGLILSPAGGRAKAVSLAVWAFAGVFELVAYFVDYSTSGGGPSLIYGLAHPATLAQYFFNLLGSALFWTQSTAFFGGLFVAFLALAALVLGALSGKLREQSFWISSLLYSLLMLAAIAVGRSGVFGSWQALAPRYTTFSLLVWVSAYAIVARVALKSSPGRSDERAVPLAALCGAALIAVAVLYSASVSYPYGLAAGQTTAAARERAATVLLGYDSYPNRVLAATFGTRARVVKKYAPVLRDLDYNVFSKGHERSLKRLRSGRRPGSARMARTGS